MLLWNNLVKQNLCVQNIYRLTEEHVFWFGGLVSMGDLRELRSSFKLGWPNGFIKYTTVKLIKQKNNWSVMKFKMNYQVLCKSKFLSKFVTLIIEFFFLSNFKSLREGKRNCLKANMYFSYIYCTWVAKVNVSF